MKEARSIVAVILVAAALIVYGQVRESVTVNVIEVPVTVVDSSGNPVRGLTAANFELLDNGTKRDITSFDKIDFASSESMSAISPMNPNARRQFMLLFDLGYASPSGLARAQDAARKFVKDSVQPRDLVAIGTIEPDRGFRLLTAFTTDRSLVASAIADPKAFRGTDPLQIANKTEAFKPSEDAGTVGSGPGHAAEAAAEERETAGRMQHLNEAVVRQRIEKQIDYLADLAKTMRAVPGRKQIILLSEGFDPKYLEGRDVRAGLDTQKENDQVMLGQSFNVDNDQRYGNTAAQKTLSEMAQYFKQSDVVLNAIDVQGIRVQNDVQTGATINSNAGLFLLSRPTGGETFENVNNMSVNFQRMLHQQELVYVLGFQAPTQKPGAFHNLKVKLVNVPGSAKLSYRAGYFEAGGETPQERTLSNAEIIVNDIPQSDVHLTALAAAFPSKTAGREQVPVILEADGPGMMKDMRGSTLPVEMFIYAFDQDGVVRDRLYQKISLDMHKVGDKLRAGGLKYYGTLSLPPGTYAVKSLIRVGDSDRRGFGRTDLVVPKPDQLAITTPVPMDESPHAVLVKGTSHAEASAPPFQLNGDQFIPAAAAHKTGGLQKIVVYVYGATADQLTWETTPRMKYLGSAKAPDATVLVMELDPKDATAQSVDVTVRRKGASESQKTSVAIEQ